jgi:hypothetical protein
MTRSKPQATNTTSNKQQATRRRQQNPYICHIRDHLPPPPPPPAWILSGGGVQKKNTHTHNNCPKAQVCRGPAFATTTKRQTFQFSFSLDSFVLAHFGGFFGMGVKQQHKKTLVPKADVERFLMFLQKDRQQIQCRFVLDLFSCVCGRFSARGFRRTKT